MAVKEKSDKKPVSGKAIEAAKKKNILYGSGKPIFEIYHRSIKDKIYLVRRGISKKDLIGIKNEAELDYNDLENILSVSRSTLINKKGNQKFDQATSERILLLNDMVAYGQSVFGDREIFNEWLKTPSEALGKITPLSMMDTIYGIEEVKKELERIAYGVY